MNTSPPTHWLRQAAQIQHMERGKLSIIRQGPDGPYYKLQTWEQGKNVSRYVPREQAAAVKDALEGYRQFHELTEQYVQQVIAQTRAERAAGTKKKPRRPTSSRRKSGNSSS